MPEHQLEEVVRRIGVVFSRRNVRHALIGGLAVGLRSRPRATKDADFIVHVPSIAFPGLLEELVSQGFSLDVMDVIRRWPLDRFVVFYCGQVRIDWMQPVIPLYANVLAAAEATPWLDTEIRVATAEGIILTKMLAFRTQDQADIETLLIANCDAIDVELIRREWSAVAEGEETRSDWLEATFARLLPRRT